MNKTQKNKRILEDQLADFTDNILTEKTAEVDEKPFSPDSELRALEQTALRLKNAFHEDGPNEEVIQRMRKNITVQWEQHKQEKRESILNQWLDALKLPKPKWQSQQTRQIRAMLSYVMVMLGLFLLSILLFNGVYSGQPAASGHELNSNLLVASGVLLVLLVLWLNRRK